MIRALIQAGLSGVRREPGIVTLPATLTEALSALEADEIASSWMPPTMRRSYVDVKRL